MATENVLAWLDQNGWPLDLYDLFGRWIFDPDLDAMRSEVALAARELLPYQSHANPHTAKRAMKLLTEHVGHASAVLSNPNKLSEENARILDTLRHEFAARHGAETSKWNKDELLNWLVAEARVHPAAAENTVASLLGIEPPKPRVSVFGPRAAEAEFSDTVFVAEPEPEQRPQRRPAGPPPLVRGVHIKEKTCPMCGTRVPERNDVCSRCAYDFTASIPDVRRGSARGAVAVGPARTSSPGKIAAIVAAAVGIPLVLLVGVVIWIVSNNRDKSDSTNDEGSQTNNATTDNGKTSTTGVTVASKTDSDPGTAGKTEPKDPGKTPPGIVNVPSKPPVKVTQKPPVKVPPATIVALTQRKPTPADAGLGFDYWKKKALTLKGADEMNALLNAYALARTDEDRAEMFAFLAFNDNFLAAATFDDLKTGIDALSKSTRHYYRIARLLARVTRERDVLALINLFVSRLQIRSWDTAAQRALLAILNDADAMKRLSTDDILASYERAHRYISGSQNSVAASLVRVIVAKGDVPAALKRGLTGLSQFSTKKAAGDFTEALLLHVTSDRTRFPQIPRSDIFAAYAGVIRAASLYQRSTLAGNLLSFTEKDGTTASAVTYFKNLHRINSRDDAAEAVLSRYANNEYDKARLLSGLAKVRAIDAAIALAPTTSTKANLYSRASYDFDYMRNLSFDRGLALHEMLVARYLPPNPRISYSASREADRLAKYADGKGNLSTIKSRYLIRLKDPKDLLARECYNAIAIMTAENYDKTVRTWTAPNYSTLKARLKDFDNAARAATYAKMLLKSGFKRGLTSDTYLEIREEIIGNVSEAERPAAIRSLVYDVKYGMPLPSTSSQRKSNRTGYVSYRVRRLDAAVTYFSNRTRLSSATVANLQTLHAILKDRTTSTLNYPTSTAISEMAADKAMMATLETVLRGKGISP